MKDYHDDSNVQTAELRAQIALLRTALQLALAYMDVSLGSPSWKGENPYPVIYNALGETEQ